MSNENGKFTRGDWLGVLAMCIIMAFVLGASTCSRLTTTASQACRVLAGEPENSYKVQWDDEMQSCVRYPEPVKLPVGQ